MTKESRSVRLEPLLVIAFLALADTSFIAPILSSYARSIGASDFEAGLIVGIYSFVAIPATIAMGYLIDRIGRKILVPLFIGDAVSIYMYSLSQTPWQLVSARVLHALFDSGVFPASLSIFRDAISGRRVGRYIGLYWFFVSIAIVLGSSMSAAMVARFGFRLVFIFLSILMVFGLIASLLVREIYLAPKARKDISFAALRDYLPVLIPSYIAAFALYISIGSVTGALSSNLIRYMGLDSRGAGVATGIYMAIASLVTMPVNILAGLAIDRRGPRFSLLIGLISLMISMSVLSIDIGTTARYISAILHGIAIAFILVAGSQIASEVPERARASSAAIFNTMLLLGVALGSPIAGHLAGLAFTAAGGLRIYLSFLLPAILGLISIAIVAILHREHGIEKDKQIPRTI